MKSSIPPATRPVAASRLSACLLLALPLTGLMGSSLAFAEPREDRQEHGRDYHQHGHRQHHRGEEHRPEYRYAQPVYVPAPEYYQPLQSPGISLFLPLDLRR